MSLSQLHLGCQQKNMYKITIKEEKISSIAQVRLCQEEWIYLWNIACSVEVVAKINNIFEGA